ncbi:MAG: ABC transporter substrate-binding protein [Gemmatimonadaceae bacterium]|nr:ABC transporter substrate-binding protein [Gemmatimonadaceae bacterium]
MRTSALLFVALAACTPRAAERPSSASIVVGVGRVTQSLDPRDAALRPAVELSFLLYDRLVGVDSLGNPVPELAARWRIDDAAREVVFVLRADARFHDGTPVRAADVVRSLSPGATDTLGREQLTPLLRTVDGGDAFLDGRSDRVRGLDARDDSTVAIRFVRGHLLDVPLFSGTIYAIRGPRASATVAHGSGPWRLVRRERGDSLLVLARVRPAPGWPDTLRYHTIPFGDLGAAIVRKEVDCVPFINATVRRDLVARTDIVVRDDGPLNLQMIDFSPRSPRWHDVRARRAIAHLIDRPTFLRALSLRGTVTSGLLVPGGVNDDAAAPPIAHDPVRARELLDSAGIRDGDTVRLFVNAGFPMDTLHGVIGTVGASLRALGRVPVYLPSGDFTVALERGDVDLAAFSLGMAPHQEPLEAYLAAGRVGNAQDVLDRLPDIGPLERRARTDRSPADRQAALRAINRLFIERQPVVPLWFAPGSIAARHGVEGCSMEAAAQTRFLTLRRTIP